MKRAPSILALALTAALSHAVGIRGTTNWVGLADFDTGAWSFADPFGFTDLSNVIVRAASAASAAGYAYSPTNPPPPPTGVLTNGSGVAKLAFTNGFDTGWTRPGYVRFSPTVHSIVVDTDVANVSVTVGGETIVPCRNVSGHVLTNGVLVSSVPGPTAAVCVDLFDCFTPGRDNLVGMVTADAEANAVTMVTQFGEVHDLDTSGASAESAEIYACTNGLWTETMPTGTATVWRVGFVTQKNANNGIVFVFPQKNGFVKNYDFESLSNRVAAVESITGTVSYLSNQATNATLTVEGRPDGWLKVFLVIPGQNP